MLTELKLHVQPLSFFRRLTLCIRAKYTRDWNCNFDQKREQHPSAGDDASTAEATSGRVRRDEPGEARRANTTPNGGPQLELGHLRLETWTSPLQRRHGQHIYTYPGIFISTK